MANPWVSDERLFEIAEDMQVLFEVGNLHSRSTSGDVAAKAREYLADEGLPTKRSVCFLVAKYASLLWLGKIEEVKKETS